MKTLEVTFCELHKFFYKLVKSISHINEDDKLFGAVIMRHELEFYTSKDESDETEIKLLIESFDRSNRDEYKKVYLKMRILHRDGHLPERLGKAFVLYRKILENEKVI